MPFGIGWGELVIVLVIIMIIFGVGRLPEIGGALGRGMREFRKAQKETEEFTKKEIIEPIEKAGEEPKKS